MTDLVSLSACGSFKAELPPGTFVLIDQFVDRTHARASSFFGAGCVAHVSMAHPVSPRLRIHLAEAARVEGIQVVRDGTYVCMEGPRTARLFRIGSEHLDDVLHGHGVVIRMPAIEVGHHEAPGRAWRGISRASTSVARPAPIGALDKRVDYGTGGARSGTVEEARCDRRARA